mgnify:CR=1 FL=1
MNKFSATKAAFSIFDFMKFNRNFVLKYIAFYFFFIVAYLAAMWAIGYFDLFKIMMESAASGNPEAMDIAALNQWSGSIVPKMGLVMILSAGAWVMYISAVLRKMLRNEEIGFHGLSWGKDENRMALAFLVYFGLYIGFYLMLVVGLLIGGGIAWGLGQISPILSGIISVLIGIGFFCALFAFIVRLSQFGVLTIANRKMGTIDSFKETRGNFWSFFGAHFILSFIVMLVMFVLLAVGVMIYGNNLGMPGAENSETLSAIMPQFFAIGLIYSLIAGFVMQAQICVGAYAYKVMHEGEELPSEPDATPHIWPTLGE